MTNFKGFASLVLAATIRFNALRRNPLPGKCRQCSLPSRQSTTT